MLTSSKLLLHIFSNGRQVNFLTFSGREIPMEHAFPPQISRASGLKKITGSSKSLPNLQLLNLLANESEICIFHPDCSAELQTAVYWWILIFWMIHRFLICIKSSTDCRALLLSAGKSVFPGSPLYWRAHNLPKLIWKHSRRLPSFASFLVSHQIL